MVITGISLGASLLAGFAAFFSPCVLPLLPVYMSVLAGSGDVKQNRGNLFLNTLAFVIGFSIIFVLLGLSVSAISQYLMVNRDTLTKVAGVLVAILGLFLTGVVKLPFLMREHRRQVSFQKITPVSALILGVAFSLGWTPCIGPVLSSVLIMAGSHQSYKTGFVMLLLFSAGLGLPFLILSLLMERLTGLLQISKRYMPYFQKASGIILIILGVMLFLGLY